MLALPKELTQIQASACLRDLVPALGTQGDEVVVDAGALTRFDSAALAVLLELRRETAALGKPFSVSKMPARLADLASLYGISGLLPAA